MTANIVVSSDQFVPLGQPVPAPRETANAPVGLRVLPQAPAPAVFEPLIAEPPSPAPETAPETCVKPTITVQRKGEAVSSIRVKCGCGNVIELNCLH